MSAKKRMSDTRLGCIVVLCLIGVPVLGLVLMAIWNWGKPPPENDMSDRWREHYERQEQAEWYRENRHYLR